MLRSARGRGSRDPRWSRRELLATFLGAAFAGACKTPRRTAFDGALLGPDVARGHRMRDVDLSAIDAARLPIERARVVIVGGGAAGLSCAWRLVRRGMDLRDLRVLELEDDVGGTARGGRSAVAAYPWGAHYVPVPSSAPGDQNASMVALFTEMGVLQGRDAKGAFVVAEDVVCRAPEERLLHRGDWSEGLYLREGASGEDLRQLKAFRAEIARLSRLRDGRGRPAFALPTSRCSDDADLLALDDVSMRAWMDDHGLSSPRLRWLVEYGCRDDYGLSLDATSAWAGLLYFAARVQPDGSSAPVMTWPEGNARIVAHLRAAVAPAVRGGVTVLDVRPSMEARGATTGATLIALDAQGTLRRIDADRVVMATPRFVATRVVRALRERPPTPRPLDYGAWVVANVHLRDRPHERPGVPFAWDNVFYDSPSLGYVSATHMRGVDHGPTVWTWYYALVDDGAAARGKLLSTTQQEWAQIAIADLSRAHDDLDAHVERLDVWRWGHAMPRPRVGSRRALLSSAMAAPLGAVHFAHTDLSGLALFEEAHDHGVRAADEVWAAIG